MRESYDLSNLVTNAKDRSVCQRWYQLGCQSRTGAPIHIFDHKQEAYDQDITQ